MTPEQLKTVREALNDIESAMDADSSTDVYRRIDNAFAILSTIEREGAEPVAKHDGTDQVSVALANNAKALTASRGKGIRWDTPQPAKVLTDTVEITSRRVMGKWVPQFRIDNQTFSLEAFAEANDAEWYCDMLRKAFDKLAPAHPVDIERIMEVVFDVYRNILDPDGGRSNMLRTRLANAITKA